jgi:exodeoxyribonuclease-5
MQAEESKLELSNEQKQVLYNVVTKIRSGTCERSTIGGFAGTGKTTLIKYLAKFCKEFRVCAYTGKAAEVLRKKEIFSASTIHSLIYRPDYDEDGTLLGFELVPKNEINCEGFIVDEGSMVNFDIYEDLMAYGLPIIFVGDHGQLEPIGTDFNLMKKPDYVLEEIHRNAGEIAHFAEWLRFGKKSTAYHPKSEKVKIISQRRITDDHLLAVDQVICAYNTTELAVGTQQAT